MANQIVIPPPHYDFVNANPGVRSADHSPCKSRSLPHLPVNPGQFIDVTNVTPGRESPSS
jgi:hypothetical protein